MWQLTSFFNYVLTKATCARSLWIQLPPRTAESISSWDKEPQSENKWVGYLLCLTTLPWERSVNKNYGERPRANKTKCVKYNKGFLKEVNDYNCILSYGFDFKDDKLTSWKFSPSYAKSFARGTNEPVVRTKS